MTIQTASNKAGRNILEEIHWRGMVAGASNYNQSRMAMGWYQEFVKRNIKHANVFKNVKSSSKKNKMVIGKMYIFKYWAKNDATLPFWDEVPLIFPFRETAEHIYGINLHYAPPKWRIVIMRHLYRLMNNNKMDDSTKLRLSFQKIQRIVSFGLFKPLIHCYLKSNFKSFFIEVEPVHWPIAVFLPVARWRKGNATMVYADYRKKTGLK